MVRFCCSVKPSQLLWGLFPIRTINQIFRTIPCFAPTPLPFNKRSVGFAYALSPSLFVGRGACPSRCAKPFHPHNPLKSASIPRPTPTLLKTVLSLALHYHTCLPCQRRGAVARKNSGDYRRDCFTPTNLSIPTTLSKALPPFAPHQPSQNRTIISPHNNTTQQNQKPSESSSKGFKHT